MTSNSDDPAYPTNPKWGHSALTKRELFAAMMMQGLIADPEFSIVRDVNLAVITADALLKELEKNGQ